MPGIGGSREEDDLRELQIVFRRHGRSSESATIDRDQRAW
jgi:hypothetical protein